MNLNTSNQKWLDDNQTKMKSVTFNMSPLTNSMSDNIVCSQAGVIFSLGHMIDYGVY